MDRTQYTTIYTCEPQFKHVTCREGGNAVWSHLRCWWTCLCRDLLQKFHMHRPSATSKTTKLAQSCSTLYQKNKYLLFASRMFATRGVLLHVFVYIAIRCKVRTQLHGVRFGCNSKLLLKRFVCFGMNGIWLVSLVHKEHSSHDEIMIGMCPYVPSMLF